MENVNLFFLLIQLILCKKQKKKLFQKKTKVFRWGELSSTDQRILYIIRQTRQISETVHIFFEAIPPCPFGKGYAAL